MSQFCHYEVRSDLTHHFRWTETNYVAIDEWCQHMHELYHRVRPSTDLLLILHTIEKSSGLPMRHLIQKAGDLDSNCPWRPPTRSAVVFEFPTATNFFYLLNTLSSLLNKVGLDNTRFFLNNEIRMAEKWLMRL